MKNQVTKLRAALARFSTAPCSTTRINRSREGIMTAGQRRSYVAVTESEPLNVQSLLDHH
jgi:hypothetical protein